MRFVRYIYRDIVLLTKNFDDLEIWVPDRSRSLKVTLVNSPCVISC